MLLPAQHNLWFYNRRFLSLPVSTKLHWITWEWKLWELQRTAHVWQTGVAIQHFARGDLQTRPTLRHCPLEHHIDVKMSFQISTFSKNAGFGTLFSCSLSSSSLPLPVFQYQLFLEPFEGCGLISSTQQRQEEWFIERWHFMSEKELNVHLYFVVAVGTCFYFWRIF